MSETKAEDNAENNCVVCCREVYIYAIGECDHPVCFECATRMRVLCRQNECPICRRELPKILFVNNRRQYADVASISFPYQDRKYSLCFEDAFVRQAHYQLLEHRCRICEKEPAFPTFVALKDHVRKTHELFFCDICIKHLLIFTCERKCYNRQDLATHRRRGDSDDTSHRGHPLCEFCNDRFLDDDELFRHLRREHFFCHFCDTDGHNHYYSDYEYLRKHFRAEHFLCEEGECLDEKFTTAFRSEIDLKAHRATVHNKGLTKAQVKQARTLELEFSIAPRGATNSDDIPPRTYYDADDSSSRRGRRRGGGYGNSNRGGAARDYMQNYNSRYENNDAISEPGNPAANPVPPSPKINMNSSQDFPVLGLASNGSSLTSASGTTPSSAMPDTLARKLAKINRFTVGSGLGDEEFPALHSAKGPAPSKIASKFKGNNSWGASGSATLSLTSSQVPTPSAAMSRKTLTVKLNSQDDFPGLSNTKKQSTVPKVSIQVDHKQKTGMPVADCSSSAANRQNNLSERQPVVTRMASSQNITFINPPASVQTKFASTSAPPVHEEPPMDEKPRPPDFAEGLSKTDGGWYVLKKGKVAKSKSPPVESKLSELSLDEDFPSLATRSIPTGLKKESKNELVPQNSWKVGTSAQKTKPDVQKAKVDAERVHSEVRKLPDKDEPQQKALQSTMKTKKKKKSTTNGSNGENVTNGTMSDSNKGKNGSTGNGQDDAPEGQENGKIKRTELKLETVSAPTAKDAAVSKEKSQPMEKNMFTTDDFPSLAPKRANTPVKRRSELNVEPLSVPKLASILDEVENVKNGEVSTTNGVSFSESDFPNLTSQPTTILVSVPPGFGKLETKLTRPPPGFVSAASIPPKKPPPGFDAVNNPPPSSATFTNSIGQNFSFPQPMPYHAYIQPDESQRRNQELAERLRDVLDGDDEKFTLFKNISGGFRKGSISAGEYYNQCVELMSRQKFAVVFPELLVLLPDIGKQQELLTVYNSARKANAASNQGSATPFLVCASCQQVLASKDFRAHESGHNLDNFPALDNLIHTSHISWVKRN